MVRRGVPESGEVLIIVDVGVSGAVIGGVGIVVRGLINGVVHDPSPGGGKGESLIVRIEHAAVRVCVDCLWWEVGARVWKLDADTIVFDVPEMCSKLICGGLLNVRLSPWAPAGHGRIVQ